MAEHERSEMLPTVRVDAEKIPHELTVTDVMENVMMQQHVMQQIKIRSLSETHPSDWKDFGGTAYLEAKGAERIRGIWRLQIDQKEIKKYTEHDAKGDYYIFVVSGTVHLRVPTSHGEYHDQMDVIGTASSRDKFFAVAKGRELPLEEIDQTHIMKSAYSDFVRECVVRILGLRYLPWEVLKPMGIEPGKVAKIEYREGVKAQPAAQKSLQSSSPQAAAANGEEKATPLQRLKNAVAARTGDHTSKAGMEILKKISTYKEFLGYSSWERLESAKNVNTAVHVYLKKIDEMFPLNGGVGGAAPTEEIAPLPDEPPTQGALGVA